MSMTRPVVSGHLANGKDRSLVVVLIGRGPIKLLRWVVLGRSNRRHTMSVLPSFKGTESPIDLTDAVPSVSWGHEFCRRAAGHDYGADPNDRGAIGGDRAGV